MKIRSCVFQVAILLLALFTTCIAAQAQWAIQNSNTTADLRGIDAVDGNVVWASGTNGTVLRSVDGGSNWQVCAIPPGAEKLDFRGVQAFDAKTAIVMASGTGDLSRLYKTTDGCKTWKLIFTNPDQDGFWDAMVAKDGRAFLIGDPVESRVVIYSSIDGSFEQWKRFGERSSLHEFKFDLSPYKGEGFFAASNSILIGDPSSGITFVSGGVLQAFCFSAIWNDQGAGRFPTYFSFKSHIPLAKGVTAGAFSFASKGRQVQINWHSTRTISQSSGQFLIVVGGDYQQPNSSSGTAAFTLDGGKTWTAAETPPNGYRSAVAYDAATKMWITVGPNGTDVSTDDGKNWRPLRPDAARGETPDADRNWNALSLPFVVGPKGRIGKRNQGPGARVQGSENQ